MEALLSIRNLSIGIQGDAENKPLKAIEEISFDIYPAEILGLVGESGSGKSLTALSIPGLLNEKAEIKSGSIIFSADAYGQTEARDLVTLSEKELRQIRGKEISMIFQEPFSSLNPLVKIGAQIAETAELHKFCELHEFRGKKNKERIKKQVKELMEKLNLPMPLKLMETYPHRLSGGMCQRVMIAMAIICRPRLLIADEPVTALDQNTQGQILALMKEINRDLGASILYISHDLGSVKNLCSRIMVMYAGRILEEGSTEEIFLNPAHEYTKGLLNSIPGKANRGKDLAAIPGKIPSLEEGRPGGCPFHPRCAKARPACRVEFPQERIISATHKTHCLFEEGK